MISATSEKLEFTTGAGVELAVRVVSSGPFGPPIPGGGSFTSRLNPRSNPPPFARVMSVCAIRGRYRSTSISRLFSSASAIASANERYSWPGAHQIENPLRILKIHRLGPASLRRGG